MGDLLEGKPDLLEGNLDLFEGTSAFEQNFCCAEQNFRCAEQNFRRAERNRGLDLGFFLAEARSSRPDERPGIAPAHLGVMTHDLSRARAALVALALALTASAAAQDDGRRDGADDRACVRMSCGTDDTSGADEQDARGDRAPLSPDQVQGDEPDDFEFEPSREAFGQEQTEGDEPDDFEFEGR
jgi:hypothetical protein